LSHPQSATRPAALHVVLGLIVFGGLLTFVAALLDRQFLGEMFRGNDDASDLLPTFTTVRLVADAVGFLVVLGLFAATFVRMNWARILLALACIVCVVANLGAAAGAAFMLVAGRGAFNEGGDTTSTGASVLNGLSLVIDLFLALMLVVCAVILFTGKTRKYTQAVPAPATPYPTRASASLSRSTPTNRPPA
jgi:hypothetical protein